MIASAVAGEIRLWNANTGARLRILSENQFDVSSVAFSPDDRLIAGGGDGNIRLWDVTTGKLVRTLTEHPGEVSSVTFSPDGMLIAGGGDIQEYTIRLWEAGNRRTLACAALAYLLNNKLGVQSGRGYACRWKWRSQRGRYGMSAPANFSVR